MERAYARPKFIVESCYMPQLSLRQGKPKCLMGPWSYS